MKAEALRRRAVSHRSLTVAARKCGEECGRVIAHARSQCNSRRFSAFALSLCLLPACTQDGGAFARKKPDPNRTDKPPPAESNVVGVVMYKGPEPWIKFGPEGDQKPDGIRLTLLLQAGGKAEGVYGDGVITITMYRTDKDARGRSSEVQVKDWTFTPEQALAYQVRRKTAYGWPYSFRLNWGNAEARGHDVRFVARFTRRDGAVITSGPLYARVPENVSSGVQ